MLRKIVNSQARRFVPSTKEPILLQAFTKVSWTRSSARSILPQRDTAKARRLGMTDRRSAVICELAARSREGGSGILTSVFFLCAAVTCRPCLTGSLRRFRAAAKVQENALAQVAPRRHRRRCVNADRFDRRFRTSMLVSSCRARQQLLLQARGTRVRGACRGSPRFL